MRKAIVLAVALALLAGAFVGPAAASDPITFEASGRFAVANIPEQSGVLPAYNWGVTGTEFVATCAIPSTQGLDGYVVELPDEISTVPGEVSIKWSDMAGIYVTSIAPLYMVFFGADCRYRGWTGYPAAGQGDYVRHGTFDAGTKYILVSAKLEVFVEFTLTAVVIRSESAPAPRPSGSPSPSPEPSPTAEVVLVDRALDLALRGHLRTHGTLVADEEVCRSRVPVDIERKNSERWVVVGSTTTGADGDFELKIPDRSGRYRAVAPEAVFPEMTCTGATSQQVRHRH